MQAINNEDKKVEGQVAKHFKIAMLGQKRIPSREGGIEVVVEELSTRLYAMGHTVTCYNRRGKHVSGGEIFMMREYKGVTIITVPTIDVKGLAALSSSFFASLLCAFGKYDIVHYHAEGPCAFMWIPKLMGKRCIATIHGLDWAREKWRGTFAEKFIKYGERMAVKDADEIIVLSKGVQNYFSTKYGRETQFIPNGINRPKKVEAELIIEKFGLEKDSYLLFLGRIVPEKGLRYLVESFKSIESNKKLVIAGGSSDTCGFYDEIKEMASKDERIIFTGFVEGQILAELFSNAYVYVLPSELEGMPISLLEAMSYGDCCLVSDIPECADVVEDKAVVFKSGDIVDLTEKLKWLIRNPNLVERYRKQAVDYILGKYDWEDIAKRTVALYTTKEFVN